MNQPNGNENGPQLIHHRTILPRLDVNSGSAEFRHGIITPSSAFDPNHRPSYAWGSPTSIQSPLSFVDHSLSPRTVSPTSPFATPTDPVSLQDRLNSCPADLQVSPKAIIAHMTSQVMDRLWQSFRKQSKDNLHYIVRSEDPDDVEVSRIILKGIDLFEHGSPNDPMPPAMAAAGLVALAASITTCFQGRHIVRGYPDLMVAGRLLLESPDVLNEVCEATEFVESLLPPKQTWQSTDAVAVEPVRDLIWRIVRRFSHLLAGIDGLLHQNNSSIGTFSAQEDASKQDDALAKLIRVWSKDTPLWTIQRHVFNSIPTWEKADARAVGGRLIAMAEHCRVYIEPADYMAFMLRVVEIFHPEVAANPPNPASTTLDLLKLHGQFRLCPHCDSKFSRTNRCVVTNFNRHLKTTHDPNPELRPQCEKCGKGFPRLDNLKRHQKEVDCFRK